MQEPYDQGLANRIGPVPCAGVREGTGEASVRGSAGWVSSRESNLRDADPVGKWGRQYGPGRHGEPYGRSRVVIDPRHVQTLLAREPGDLSFGRRHIAAGPHRGGR
jgi:hypothetical protein